MGNVKEAVIIFLLFSLFFFWWVEKLAYFSVSWCSTALKELDGTIRILQSMEQNNAQQQKPIKIVGWAEHGLRSTEAFESKGELGGINTIIFTLFCQCKWQVFVVIFNLISTSLFFFPFILYRECSSCDTTLRTWRIVTSRFQVKIVREGMLAGSTKNCISSSLLCQLCSHPSQ